MENNKENVIKTQVMTKDNEESVAVTSNTIYVGFRYIEGICIAVFIFGVLWEGVEILKLTLPQFLMVYGGAGAIISELMARFTLGRIKKKTKETVE